jgi:hypothetical protein
MKEFAWFSRMFRRRQCQLPALERTGSATTRLRAAHLVPLILFAVPTALVGYGVVLPRSCAAGLNSLSIGFGGTVLSACVTYLVGIRSALRG